MKVSRSNVPEKSSHVNSRIRAAGVFAAPENNKMLRFDLAVSMNKRTSFFAHPANKWQHQRKCKH
jgi:hypothetical protein